MTLTQAINELRLLQHDLRPHRGERDEDYDIAIETVLSALRILRKLRAAEERLAQQRAGVSLSPFSWFGRRRERLAEEDVASLRWQLEQMEKK